MFLLAWILGCSDKGDDSAAAEADADTDSDTDTDTDTDADPITKDDAEAILDQAALDIATSNASGAQIAVWYDGRVAYHWEVGANPGSGDPITDDMLFQIGSDTKKLTAMAVLQQEAAGTLSLDDTLADVLGGYEVAQDPGWSAAVTIHDLISHQGETYDYTPWDSAPDDSDLAARADVFAKRGWIHAPPGTYWNYSNTNFSLAGLAVEVASGRPYADVLQEDVIDALGLTHTFVRLADVVTYGNTATGFGIWDLVQDPFDLFGDATYETGAVTLDHQVDNAYTRPAGFVWSTATDMAALGGFFLEGNAAVLSDADRGAVLTQHVPLYPSFEWSGYGYGTFVQRGFTLSDGFHDETLISHGGNTLSMTSLWWVFPAEGVAISILSNGYGDDFSPTAVEIIERLEVVGAPTAIPSDFYPLTETDHSLLAGTYVDPDIGEIDVWDDKGDLKIAIPAFEKLGYSVAGDLEFNISDVYITVVEGAAYDVTFIPDGKGGYGWIRNREFVGTRSDVPKAAPRSISAGAEARIAREMVLHEGRYRPLPLAPRR
jgi:CubicO group peptidase (beta-lactamase class C family)